ncbi:MAG: DNA-processing protein DprA [Lachnospiraceae bacterium]|nr:DNA-processing protein DprA [Lachnospiraceae bacterium]
MTDSDKDERPFGEVDNEILTADAENEKIAQMIRDADGLEADKYIMQFCRANLSRIQIITMLNRFGSIRAAYNAEKDEILALKELGPEAPTRFLNVRDTVSVEEEWEWVRERGIGFVSFIDADYPERLEQIAEPPVGLFVMGKLPLGITPSIAIVGSRECSNYGKEVAIDVAKKLARAGIDVISGMASGIDGYAHRGALNGGGETFAILGCGVDICYPRENIDIYARIQKKGGIISEYYPGTQPVSYNFPRRNRLISALSDGILVVEARQRSGSWITVDYGLEQGKDIYAVPGRVGDLLSIGCNNLIRNGAKAVTKAQDIIEDLAPRYLAGRRRNEDDKSGKKKKAENEELRKGKNILKSALKEQIEGGKDQSTQGGSDEDIEGLGDDEMRVYKVLDLTACSVEEICAKSGLSAEKTVRTLTMLEIKGKCMKVGNGGYARKL